MLLPDPKRCGEIHFVFAKSMTYTSRLAVMALLLLAGFALQLILDWVVIGSVFLLVASMMGIVKGYTNVPGEMGSKKEWRAGDKKQLEKIIEVAKKSKSWDQSFIDITCTQGCFSLIAVLGIFILFYFVMSTCGYLRLAFTISVDATILLLPHWVTGVRRILTNAPLTVKVENLLHAYSIWEANKKDGENMAVQLEVVKGKKGEMPVDAKLILQIPAIGENFFGIQTQVVLNNVQGADYPYLYCVLVAKSGLGMKNTLSKVASEARETSKETGSFLSRLLVKSSPGICAEWNLQDGMDILVIRQQTTQQTGYHTDKTAIERIFKFALGKARSLK
ncbi:MAG TPA: hypothetical protein DCZ94_17605 [Lentisphaeria bacterium]|nr:MAG: hypothetical protein A2X48_13205 [Lentisphaerae bacterium GWF2_49_21]HBC88761.1 hypothetical protein [Lentisphaeria bacterium]